MTKTTVLAIVAALAAAPLFAGASAPALSGAFHHPLCSSKTIEIWQRRDVLNFKDAASRLPIDGCVMQTDTERYLCTRNVGCSSILKVE